jgi:CheY-like chemotaxis protein
MGGDITVASKLGEGTTFTTLIPFEESQVQEEVKQASVVDAAAIQKLKHLKILLVEDNEFNRMVAEDTLKEIVPGITVHMAENGKAAIDRLKHEMYDLVLMDIQMPVMDGMEATKIIRSALPEPARSVKIIAMTANVMQEEVQKYFDIGMNAYVSKPFHADELLLKMDALAGGTPVSAPKKEEPNPGTSYAKEERAFPPLPSQVTDMTFLKQFTGGNPDKQKKYVGMFLENAPKLLDNIEKALAIKDFPTIKIAAHSLKPQLSYMGVKEEISNIFLIEQTAGETAHQESLQPLVNNLKHLCAKAFEELKSVN